MDYREKKISNELKTIMTQNIGTTETTAGFTVSSTKGPVWVTKETTRIIITIT